MITSSAWRGKRYAVLGLARSGRATVDALLASGAEVVAWDGNEAAREETVDRAIELSHDFDAVALQLADPLTLYLTGFAGVVVSPGVPLNRHPIAAHAAKHGVPVIGDIELFAQARAELPPHKVVGITGTNGKSTTTALVHHILRTAGVSTTMGGNIGLPILGQDPLPKGGVYVLELSSYQIDLTFSLDCDVAVLLNVTPDHLDRYADFEAYVASKLRLFDMQSSEHALVIPSPNEFMDRQPEYHYRWPAKRGRRPSVLGITNDICAIDGTILMANSTVAEQSDWLALQGPHNLQNALTAIAVADELDVPLEAILTGLRTYPGLPHRMERVRTLNDVLYVNDSKATNADSTAPALAAYSKVRWILGGQAKTHDLDACAPHFSHVRSAHTIGEAGAMFADILRPHMRVEECGTLDKAVSSAAAAAEAGDTVLLSPACASFDQFKDFEDRGDNFRRLVEAL